MNILVTATTFPKNIDDSSPRFVYDLCNALAVRKKLRPIILVPHTDGNPEYEEMNGMKVYRYKYFFSKYELISGNGIVSNIKRNKSLIFLIPFLVCFQFIKTLSLIKKYDIEIIVANWLVPQGLVAVLVKVLFRKKIKIIVISHGGDVALLSKNKWFKKIGSSIVNKVDVIIAVSSFIKNNLQNIGYAHTNIPIISMGVDTKKFETGLFVADEEKEYDLIFVGRLELKKGVLYLIEALNKLNINIKTIIVGDGTEKSKLINLVNEYKLQDNIFFTGSLNHKQILPYIIKSKVFVAPSINLIDDTEGMPTVLLEAMSAGLPIITTDAGGICDVIKNDYNGIIVKQRDADDLAEKIIYLLQNLSIRNKLQINGIECVKEYSYAPIAKKYEQIIMEIYNEK